MADEVREPDQTPGERYPPQVVSAEERDRWDKCAHIARELYGPDEATVWQATRSIYLSPTPT